MKKLLSILLIIFLSSNIYSQLTAPVVNGTDKNFETLTENDGEDVFGYAEITKFDLEDKLTEKYKYRILDKNANEICNGDLTETLVKRKCGKKCTQIEYNNGFVIFYFTETFYAGNEALSITNSYQILEVATNKIVAKEYFDKGLDITTNIPKLNKQYRYRQLIALSDIGFLIQSIQEIDNRWSVYYYAINLKGDKIWEQHYEIAENKHQYEYALIQKNKNTVVLLATKSRNDKKVSDYLLVLDANNGKKIGFVDLSNETYTLRFKRVNVKDNQITIIGRYFEKEKRDRVDIEESLGLYRRIIDINTSKIISDVFLPYSKFSNLDIDENGKVRKEGYLSFQKIDINPDGTYFLIGETYVNKALGAMFDQLYAFILDKDFQPIKVESFETKRDRGAKYSFSQDLPSGIGKAYFFYDKNDSKQYDLNVINFYYKTKSFSVTKMQLNNDKSNISVVPAKAGYIGIVEYFKAVKKQEQKPTEIRLEKLNFERQ